MSSRTRRAAIIERQDVIDGRWAIVLAPTYVLIPVIFTVWLAVEMFRVLILGSDRRAPVCPNYGKRF